MNKKNRIRIFITSLFCLGLLHLGIDAVSAAAGRWQSDGRVDLNGISETGTTYAGGGKSSHSFLLKVAYHPYGYSVGSATKTISIDSMASHKCWGDPMFYKYGIVDPYSNSIYHTPWFDV